MMKRTGNTQRQGGGEDRGRKIKGTIGDEVAPKKRRTIASRCEQPLPRKKGIRVGTIRSPLEVLLMDEERDCRRPEPPLQR